MASALTNILPSTVGSLDHVREALLSFLIPESLDAAVRQGLMAVLLYYGKIRPCSVSAISEAASKGLFDVVEWGLNKISDLDEDDYDCIMYGMSLAMKTKGAISFDLLDRMSTMCPATRWRSYFLPGTVGITNTSRLVCVVTWLNVYKQDTEGFYHFMATDKIRPLLEHGMTLTARRMVEKHFGETRFLKKVVKEAFSLCDKGILKLIINDTLTREQQNYKSGSVEEMVFFLVETLTRVNLFVKEVRALLALCTGGDYTADVFEVAIQNEFFAEAKNMCLQCKGIFNVEKIIIDSIPYDILTKDEVLMKHLIMRCNDRLGIFEEALRFGLRGNDALTTTIVNNCDENCELFRIIIESGIDAPRLQKKVIYQSNKSEIFKTAIKIGLKDDMDLLSSLINQTNAFEVPEMFRVAVSNGLQNNKEIMNKLLQKSSIGHLPFLFEVAVNADPRDDELVYKIIDYSDSTIVPAMLQILMANKLAEDTQLFTDLVNKCGVAEYPSIFKNAVINKVSDDVLFQILHKSGKSLIPYFLELVLKLKLEYNEKVVKFLVTQSYQCDIPHLFRVAILYKSEDAVMQLTQRVVANQCRLEDVFVSSIIVQLSRHRRFEEATSILLDKCDDMLEVFRLLDNRADIDLLRLIILKTPRCDLPKMFVVSLARYSQEISHEVLGRCDANQLIKSFRRAIHNGHYECGALVASYCDENSSPEIFRLASKYNVRLRGRARYESKCQLPSSKRPKSYH